MTWHNRSWLYRTGQILNYLALVLYLGGLVALGAVAAPAIFRTTEGAGIVAVKNLPAAADPGRQMGGEVFGNVLQAFEPVEIGCLVALTVATVLLAASRVKLNWMAVVRLVLLAAILGIATYDYTAVWPKIWQERAAWRDALDAGQAVTAHAHQARFNALHKRSEAVAQAKVWVLLALLIASILADPAPARELPPMEVSDEEPASGRRGPQWRVSRKA